MCIQTLTGLNCYLVLNTWQILQLLLILCWAGSCYYSVRMWARLPKDSFFAQMLLPPGISPRDRSGGRVNQFNQAGNIVTDQMTTAPTNVGPEDGSGENHAHTAWNIVHLHRCSNDTRVCTCEMCILQKLKCCNMLHYDTNADIIWSGMWIPNLIWLQNFTSLWHNLVIIGSSWCGLKTAL